MDSSQAKEFMQRERTVASDGYSGFFRQGTKRMMDIGLFLVALPIAVPIITILYVIVRLDGGPGFFGHQRVGRNGRSFKVWKIRTMVLNAEQVLEEYLRNDPEAAAEWSDSFKLARDPRITPLGRFLRETSLDELPQIWNVFKGEMSFVGPRPIVRDELAKYEGREWVYLSSKPGITGLWQVSGRNDVDYRTRVEFDLTYAKTQSLYGDLVILLRTVGVVIGRTGR
ncbi:MAG: sugar transferase [Pseudomonadota bacterium]